MSEIMFLWRCDGLVARLISIRAQVIRNNDNFGVLQIVVEKVSAVAGFYLLNASVKRNLLRTPNSIVLGDLPDLSSLGAERPGSHELANRREDCRRTAVSAALLCTQAMNCLRDVFRAYASFTRSGSRPGPRLTDGRSGGAISFYPTPNLT